jgi:uncharacterized SAM-binding protein YcdF (DUF218 family)
MNDTTKQNPAPQKSRLRGLALLATSLFLVWAVGFFLFLIGVILTVPDDEIPQVDAIIVLTGGQNRINTSLDLLDRGQAGYLFVSGVNDQVKIEELVRLWRPGTDFIPCCIFLGRAANDTKGNADETSAWVRREGLDSIILVTSNYHMPRAWLEFSHALPRRLIIPYPIRPTSVDDDSKHFVQLAFGEYNKMILTWVRLYVFPWDKVLLNNA